MQLPAGLTEGSPLALFIFGLQGIAVNRATFRPASDFVGEKFEQFCDDCAMLMEEGVTIGLRVPFLRRVAVPIVMAQKHLEKGEKGAASEAIKILNQITGGGRYGNESVLLREACIAWIKEKHDVTATDQLV